MVAVEWVQQPTRRQAVARQIRETLVARPVTETLEAEAGEDLHQHIKAAVVVDPVLLVTPQTTTTLWTAQRVAQA